MSAPSKKLTLILAAASAAIILPLLAQAALSLQKPFGGKITFMTPNIPPTPVTPNPCYEPGSYLITIGMSIYVLPQYINVINGSNPPLPSVWALGNASRFGVCPTITLMGTSGLF